MLVTSSRLHQVQEEHVRAEEELFQEVRMIREELM